LISDRDTWAWNFGLETKNFNEGLKLIEGIEDPKNMEWSAILEGIGIDNIQMMGKHAVAYRNYFCKTYLQYSYETVFEGHNCIVLNLHTMGSESFMGRLKDYDIGLCYVHTGAGYIVNLYTVKSGLDVSAIAVKYGGGGHSHTAGFNCLSLPWIKKA
jgi:nanoRNase/pAp phosphatase (c-di-AMP/oligoRNAs hydrolase)